MILDRVTLTGADESVDPQDLIKLSREFPFVEWGILFSGSRKGVPRYPAAGWLLALGNLHWAVPSIKLSAHLCGRWVRDLVLKGDFTWMTEFKALVHAFDRIQLNFHADKHDSCQGFVDRLAEHGGKEYIFQLDGVNDSLYRWIAGEGVAVASPLFDTSGGAGMLPHTWPEAIQGTYCGYAGGLGPQNVAGQIRQISERAPGGTKVWIDMETKIRTDDDQRFDLWKCRAVLETASRYVDKKI